MAACRGFGASEEGVASKHGWEMQRPRKKARRMPGSLSCGAHASPSVAVLASWLWEIARFGALLSSCRMAKTSMRSSFGSSLAFLFSRLRRRSALRRSFKICWRSFFNAAFDSFRSEMRLESPRFREAAAAARAASSSSPESEATPLTFSPAAASPPAPSE